MGATSDYTRGVTNGPHGAWAYPGDDELPTVAPRVTETRPEPDEPPPPQGEVVEHQKHMPEGGGVVTQERHLTPWVIGGLAVIGLVAVTTFLAVTAGWTTAAVGVVWLLMAYAVSWSVVWGAGLLRAKDEVVVEERVEQGEPPPPRGRIG